MSGSVVPFQFQADVITGTTIAAGLLMTLLRLCANDGIQPAAIPPLELFGSLIMADSKRIDAGAKALGQARTAWWKPPLIVKTPEIARLVLQNAHLTSVFLLATACSVCFSVSKTSQIIYEMIKLSGALKDYAVTSEVVFRFLEMLNGCREGFTCSSISRLDKPEIVYQTLCNAASIIMQRSRIWIPDLYAGDDATVFASLLAKTFESVRDMENELVELRGTRGGLWIGFVLIWLRPTEVQVFLNSERLYPSESTGSGSTRMIVRLVRQDQTPSPWTIHTWKMTKQPTDPICIVADDGGHELTMWHPWRMARRQIEIISPDPEVMLNIGHLAAALVQVATERPVLQISSPTKKLVPIKATCPKWYLEEYKVIMGRLGWHDLDITRPLNIVSAISHARLGFGDPIPPEKIGDQKIFRSFIVDSCDPLYRAQFGGHILTGDTSESMLQHIVEHAVHLAAQVLVAITFYEVPAWATYRPLDPVGNFESHLFLYPFILPCKGDAQFVPLHSIHRQGIRSIIPPASIDDEILAVAGEGYVIFRSALAHSHTGASFGREGQDMAIQLDDIRQVSSYHVCPGYLQFRDTPGRYHTLREVPDFGVFANPDSQSFSPVQLFAPDGTFHGVADGTGQPQVLASIRYTMRREDAEQTIYLKTELIVSRGVPGASDVQTAMTVTWGPSISCILFAEQIWENKSTQAELEALAHIWARQQEPVVWADLPKIMKNPSLKEKAILRQMPNNPEARFFIGGIVYGLYPSEVFLRRRGVPLMHCLKVAQESKEFNWIIIP